MQATATSNGKPADTRRTAWYCLRAQPKREHIAAAHVRMLEGVTVFCPRIRFKRPTRQGPAWVTEAMFPGYLFASFDLRERHRQVRYAHCVVGIVQFGNWHAIIEDEALTAQCLAELLDDTCQVEAVGSATESKAGLRLCAGLRPDAVFVDINLPGKDGVLLGTQLTMLPQPPAWSLLVVLGHSVAHIVLQMGRQSGGRLRRFGQKRVGLSKNSVRWRLGILEDASI